MNKTNMPKEFERFCATYAIEDNGDRAIAIKTWNWAVSHVLNELLMPDGVDGYDNHKKIKNNRKEHTIIEQYPHPDWIDMVEKTKTKKINSIEEMIVVMKKDDFHGSNVSDDNDRLRIHYKEFIDEIRAEDEIWQYNNIGVLSGTRGYALYRDGKVIDGIVTTRA